MSRIDMRSMILDREQSEHSSFGDYLWCQDGVPLASANFSRRRHAGGHDLIMLYVTSRPDVPQAADMALRQLLASTFARPAAVARRFHLPPSIHRPAPTDELAAWGFVRQPGTCKYSRDAAPPRPGEFPMTDRAVARGYTVAVFEPTGDAGGADAAVHVAVADVHNRAFGARAAGSHWTAANVARRLAAPDTELILAWLGPEITGHIVLTRVADAVLVVECASLRRHWGSGSVDAMSRAMADLVWTRWRLPVIGYADAGNAASWRVMERSGMTRVADYPVWALTVPAGATPTRR
ncbi:hypothetical protein P7L78_00825 (plasmid) [Tistrella bauzanensis]|uniref:GNAT family N-acetyltransferase n=1 Tax=Tistrella arctica TaxID=3133430 RepID=A0ABU9YM02_9PROT